MINKTGTKDEVDYGRIRGVHLVPEEELYTSGHRTCEGCESALTMRQFIKVAGPRTIVTGSTGCMYVANTSYMTTPWVVPWMHTQLGAAGPSAIGTAAALRALTRKGKLPKEKVNVIAFCGDLGGADMGLSGISRALQTDYDLLVILYDNESAANTDIQATGLTTWGAQTTFTPTGTVDRVNRASMRWKKNVTAMLAVGHPNVGYVATACATFPPLDYMNKVKKALSIGGPSLIHSLDPCPKGWDYHPRYSHDIGEMAVRSGIFPLWELTNGVLKYTHDARKNRTPVREYLQSQGRFSHFQPEDVDFIQSVVNEMWEDWEVPGVLPFRTGTIKSVGP